MYTLKELIKLGQSYWMDNLSRHMIVSGELQKRVSEQGLRGITSNPNIFMQAISRGTDYDEQIKELVEKNLEVGEIYEALAVKDIQDACDILRPVYDDSDGVDGFVSLEVSPYLAHDSEGTMQEARRLYQAVDRPNVFIKIPGTEAGVPAIEQMLFEGVNINITLLFSIASYEAVAKAYVRALERRAKENKSIDDVASVASFFLSRIDVLTDELLQHRIAPGSTEASKRAENLLGKAAIASAKLAYQSFKRIFSGERWQKLADQGARVQRPLWASTSTKNPLYHDVKYVEPLIGRQTVNTMPEETIAAFADHGIVAADTVEEGVDEARKVFDDLREMGVDIDFVTRQLVNEGVQKFISPFDALLKTLARSRTQFLKKRMVGVSVHAGALKSKMTSAFAELDGLRFGPRLFAKDAFLWKTDSEHVKSIRNRLGWLDCVADFSAKLDEIREFAESCKSYKHVLLLGMGGSSLAPEVGVRSLPTKKGYPRLLILDKTDPATIRAVENSLDPTSTLTIVASKSGTTTETLNFYRYFFAKSKKHFGDKAGENFVAITDPGTPLIEEAGQKRFRRIFENSADIGGRYSALSYFGLLPMALSGVDIGKLLENAAQMRISCGPTVPAETNPGLELGALLGIAHQNGRDKLTFVLSESLQSFGDWAEQLLAESTGKEERGLVPVVGELLDEPSGYSADRIFVSIRKTDEKSSDVEKKLNALQEAGHPVVELELQDPHQLGALFYQWEIATAVAGAILKVNPFDEPNVAESKRNTREFLKQWQQNGAFSEGKPVLEENGIAIYGNPSAEWTSAVEKNGLTGALKSFLESVKEGEYVSLLPYFMQTRGRDEALQGLRDIVRRRCKAATTLGYGPRYLHSTGQLHKGGSNSGAFIILSADSGEDVEIPEQDFDFETLQRAQALGDFQSLSDKGRRVVRLHLGKDIDGSLKKILASL